MHFSPEFTLFDTYMLQLYNVVFEYIFKLQSELIVHILTTHNMHFRVALLSTTLMNSKIGFLNALTSLIAGCISQFLSVAVGQATIGTVCECLNLIELFNCQFN